MKRYQDDSFALHTDLYQINMMETYFRDGIHKRKAVFDVYFRRNPFGNGYAIFAGLERVITYIKELRFSESDITCLPYVQHHIFDFATTYFHTIFKQHIAHIKVIEYTLLQLALKRKHTIHAILHHKIYRLIYLLHLKALRRG